MRSSRKPVLAGIVGLLGTTAFVAFTVPASAGKGTMIERHKTHMTEVDTDGDGKVSKAEAEAAREAHFKTADLDGNGTVSFEEFEAMAERRLQMKLKRRFKRSDKNGDGVLTSEELETHRGGHFDKIDKDGDGEISEEERKAAHKMMRKHKRHGHRDHEPMED